VTDHRALPASARGTIVTVGTFDGVHRGHRDVLSHLVATAARSARASVVVTFEPHPLAVVNPAAAPRLLTTAAEKREVLATTGVEYLAVLPFTPTLAGYSAEQFVYEVLLRRFRMGELLVGHDHGFGRARMGDADVLKGLGDRWGFGVRVLDSVAGGDGRAISSTAIRRAVAGGDLASAATQLGRAYSVSGTVVAGEQRGRGLGFRTINVAWPDAAKLLPPDGVYAARVQTPLGAVGGMLNLGGRPTFGEHDRRLEVHLFDTEGDFYGAPVRCDFLARLRETRAFESPDALVRQLRLDEEEARARLAATDRGIG
jgi:riboflavin kinase / FMN adenylyltransferase